MRSTTPASQLRVRGAFVMLADLCRSGPRVRRRLARSGPSSPGSCSVLADRDDRPNIDVFNAKLDAIGFGFLIPVFFVATGCPVQRRTPCSPSASALELVPLLVVAIVDRPGRAGPAPSTAPSWAPGPAIAVGLPAVRHPDLPRRGGRDRTLAQPAQPGHGGGAHRRRPALRPALPGHSPWPCAHGRRRWHSRVPRPARRPAGRRRTRGTRHGSSGGGRSRATSSRARLTRE